MRLHHLRLRGIGPFRDEVDLDFAALGASGMFLLEGPTGSGKSTILDAIVYALYGSVAGTDTSGARIRSQFAAPTEPSVVDLVFETGSGIYRVRREPEYQRAKRRGTGTTRENAKALLWRLGSPDVIEAVLADRAGTAELAAPLATRLDEVGREVARAIGLTREQFTQTVLLPQGEFARFLRADTKERQAVLTRVFGTEIYEDIEARLVEMRKAAKGQVTEASATLRTAVARFAEAAGCEDDVRQPLEGDAAELRLPQVAERADAVTEEVARRAAEAAQASTVASDHESAARAAHDAARERRRLLHRRAELDDLAARLADAAEQAATDARRLRRDEAAREVAGAFERRDTAGLRAAQAIERRSAAVDAARTDAPDLAQAAATEDALTTLAEAAETSTTRVGELATLVALERGIAERERELTAQREDLDGLRAREAEQRDLLAARPAEREAVVRARDAARQGADGIAEARVAVHRAQDRLTAAETADRHAAEVERAEARAVAALAAARTAADAEHALRRRRTEGLAAELALDLDAGEACPVCGATEHPRPATPGADHVSAERVAQAERERRDADAAQAAATSALDVARAQHRSALAAADALSVADATAALGTARERVGALEAEAARAARLDADLERHDRETATRRDTLDGLSAQVTQLTATVQERAETLAADIERVREAREDHESVADRQERHRHRARTATLLREAVLTADQAAARARELETDAASALATANASLTDAGEAPFADETAVRDALLDDATRAGLAAAARQRAIDEARLADGLAEPGVADVVADENALAAADEALAAAGTALAEASAAARSAQSEAGRLAGAARRTSAARTSLDSAITQVTHVRAHAGTVVRVADLATGASADGERIRLSTFVLMRRFEDVIDAANARLALLSGADLELVRDSAARGAQRTGLDLLVIDRRTDQARVPETLSGGETFFVSLALALGLADIVTAEAGGVQLQTLFIDEGFGSLDPERLDAVIAEIGRLADTGRTVGIVSHVAELKTRIPEQIHVRRREDRTSAVTVTA